MKCLLLTRRGGERGNTLKLLTIVDSSATNSASFFFLIPWLCGREKKNGNKLLSCQRKTDTCGIVLLLMFEALK